MNYDFNTVINRKNTDSLKYMNHPKYPLKTDLIPLWVADMDFKTVPEVTAALEKSVDFGIYGYSLIDDEYYSLFINWYRERFGCEIFRNQIVPTEGVMSAIASAIRALTNEEDSVLMFQPVYYPFEKVIIYNKRRPIISELIHENGRYEIDFNDFENKIVSKNVKAVLFCSPHNPVGRVWDCEELERFAAICSKHNVTIISDEIHADLTYKKHIPLIALPEAESRTVLCTSVTKTFNLAGIQGANVIIPNQKIRSAYVAEIKASFSALSSLSVIAEKAAYQYGKPWLNELLEYLKDNINYVIEQFKDTKISVFMPEGTYLLWLDCRELGMCDKELEDFFINACSVLLNSGYTFGKGGGGFMRMNVACPRVTLEKAVNNILKELQKL